MLINVLYPPVTIIYPPVTGQRQTLTYMTIRALFITKLLLRMLEKLLLRMHSCYFFILSISYIMFMNGYCAKKHFIPVGP